MKVPGWWKLRSGHAKAVPILALLLVLECGLCATSIPLESGSPVEGALLVVSIITFVMFMIALISWLVDSMSS
jgi:hypothetical protein